MSDGRQNPVVCQGCGAKYDPEIADDECPVCDRPRELPNLDYEIEEGEHVRVVYVGSSKDFEPGNEVLLR